MTLPPEIVCITVRGLMTFGLGMAVGIVLVMILFSWILGRE